MQAHDASIAQLAAPHLRPGETVTSTAFVERQVPALVRTLRFIRFAYLEDFQVAVTNERLLLFTRGGRLFGRKAGSPAAIEHADLVKAETPQVLAIGSIGMRLTLANGLVYEFLVPKKLAGYEGQEAFVSGYIPWLAQGIAARGFAPRGPEFPRLPGLDMPPMLAHGALAVVGTGFALFNLTGLFAWLSAGYLGGAFMALMATALGAAAAVFAIEKMRTRSARLRGETPVSLLSLATTHRRKLGLAAAAVAALMVVGGIVSFVSDKLTEQRDADIQAESDAQLATALAGIADERAAAALRPALSQWPPENPPPSDPPLAAAPAIDVVRARLTGYGFTLADVPASDPLVAWSLIATGTRGQRLTLTVESAASSDNASRSAGPVVSVAVQGPDAQVRERILARLRNELMPSGPVLGEALRAGGVVSPTVAGSAAHGADASGSEYRVVARSLTRNDSSRRNRYCVTSATASVCAESEIDEANYTLTGTTTFHDVRRDWSTWAARVAAGAP